MNRYAKERKRPVNAPRVERVELDEKNVPMRIIGTILFLLLAVTALTYGITRLLNAEKGWQEITVGAAERTNCSSEFVLYYELGNAGVSARTEKRAVTSVYTTACENAYELFYNEESGQSISNLYDLNRMPNTETEIDSALYRALEQLDRAGNRYLYYAPLYPTITNLCTAPSDLAAMECDPEYSEELRTFFDEVLAFANDPASVTISLLGDNRACLRVSEDYLAFAEQNEIVEYVDFYALRNAFAADYIADKLISAGYTAGMLSSQEGYIRVLGKQAVTFAISDREGAAIYTVADVSVSGMTSIVSMRDHAASQEERDYFYRYQNGEIRTPYLSADGTCVSPSISAVTACSETMGCADLILRLLPYFTGTTETIPDTLYTVYCRDRQILSTIPNAEFSNLYNRDGIAYCLK